VKAVGEQLGARYLVDGNVRIAAERLRLRVQLIETSGGNQVWSERFEGDAGDVHVLLDRVTREIAEALYGEPEVWRPLLAEPLPAGGFEALDLALRGDAELRGGELARAERSYLRALETQLPLGRAHAGLAAVRLAQLAEAPAERKPQLLAEALGRAREAVAIEPTDPRHYEVLAHAGFAVRDWEEVRDAGRRALTLNPSSVRAHVWLAYSLIAEGRSDDARVMLARAHELSPRGSLEGLVLEALESAGQGP